MIHICRYYRIKYILPMLKMLSVDFYQKLLRNAFTFVQIEL